MTAPTPINALVGADGQEKWLLRLYIAGQSPKSLRALDTADLLRELGVTFAQGYLYGRPAPIEDKQLDCFSGTDRGVHRQ